MGGGVSWARGRWAVGAWLGAVALLVSAASCAGLKAGIAEAETLPPDISVRVVDAAGAPIDGVKVSGQYAANPGPFSSTCCTMVSLGVATTGPDGRAVLVGVKGTDGPLRRPGARS